MLKFAIAKDFFSKMKEKWVKCPLFSSFFVFAFVFLIFNSLYINNSGVSSLDDHFFNYKYSYLVRTDGLNVANNFNWIYLYKDDGTLLPFSLFQITLIPFTYIKDMIWGLRISDAFWASLSLGLIYYVFRKLKVVCPLFFIIILMTSGYFSQRIIIGRSFVLTTSLVLLEMYLAVGKKYKKLFFISLIHVLWHPTNFFMPIIMSGIVEVSRYISSYKIYFKNLIFSVLGIILGMSFFPGFLSIFWKYANSIISLLITHSDRGLGVEGAELYAKNPLEQFWGSSDIFFLLAMIGSGTAIYYYVLNKKEKGDIVNETKADLSILMYVGFIFLIFSVFGAVIISGRFYDYYFIGTITLFSAALTKLHKDKKIIFDLEIFRYISVAIIIFFIFSAGNNLLNIRLNISRNDFEPIKKVSEWVKDKSENKDKIFLNNWSWFGVSFFYNHKNIYTMGVEPQFLYDYNPELYWKWFNIYKYGYYCEKNENCLSEAVEFKEKLKNSDDEQRNKMEKENSEKIVVSIKNEFGAKFIVSDSLPFNAIIELNKDLIEDSFESKSDVNGGIFKAYKLK